MKYILHIGPMKTGTKSLQRAFYENRYLLPELGIKYPRPLQGTAHHALARAISGQSPVGYKLPQNWREIFRKETAGEGICVISSEAFSTIHDLSTVTPFFPPNKTMVVMYLREPVTHIASWYQQKIFSETLSMSFRDFAKHNYIPLFEMASRWIQVYGRENVMLRHYDRECMLEGDIVIDFASLIRPELIELFKLNSYRINPGIAGNLLFIKRILNCFISVQECISIENEIKELKLMKSDFNGKIPVDSKTANQIVLLTRAQFDALENQFGISIKPYDRQIEAPLTPDCDKLQYDLSRILEKARKEEWNIAEIIERYFSMLASDETLRTFAKNTTDMDQM